MELAAASRVAWTVAHSAIYVQLLNSLCPLKEGGEEAGESPRDEAGRDWRVPQDAEEN